MRQARTSLKSWTEFTKKHQLRMIRRKDPRVPKHIADLNLEMTIWQSLPEDVQQTLFIAKDAIVPSEFIQEPMVFESSKAMKLHKAAIEKAKLARELRAKELQEQQDIFLEETSALSYIELLTLKQNLDEYDETPRIILTRHFLSQALSQFHPHKELRSTF